MAEMLLSFGFMFTVGEIGTVCFSGISAVPIAVQVHVAGGGLPCFSIVGLPDKAVNESRERIRAALQTLGLALPPKRITISLSPANIQKEGNHYDLPLAMGLLGALGILPLPPLAEMIALGELGLDGQIRPVRGTLSAALLAAGENKTLVCPGPCGSEAVWGGDIEILAPDHLVQIVKYFKQEHVFVRPEALSTKSRLDVGDFSDIRGQDSAKRALMIAAAGQHNVLISGPPGAGKSMMAERISGILPDLSAQQSLEVTMIHSIAGQLEVGALVRSRPFRNPHHSISMPALVGGGARGLPGEISLAHAGVLFLDELPEFQRTALESLRQSLETHQAVVSRVNARVVYPADFQLIAAMNPCRCGYMGDLKRQCAKAPACGTAYQRALSGPLLERFDMVFHVPAVPVHALMPSPDEGRQSPALRKKVQEVRDHHARLGWSLSAIASELDGVLARSPDGRAALTRAMEKLDLSARSYYRIVRLARTIALLDGKETLGPPHVYEAISYRPPAWNA
jgi:magnesium chelatase family protein